MQLFFVFAFLALLNTLDLVSHVLAFHSLVFLYTLIISISFLFYALASFLLSAVLQTFLLWRYTPEHCHSKHKP